MKDLIRQAYLFNTLSQRTSKALVEGKSQEEYERLKKLRKAQSAKMRNMAKNEGIKIVWVDTRVWSLEGYFHGWKLNSEKAGGITSYKVHWN